jgi:hypothetical protein
MSNLSEDVDMWSRKDCEAEPEKRCESCFEWFPETKLTEVNVNGFNDYYCDNCLKINNIEL